MPVQNSAELFRKLQIITILPKSRLRDAAIPGDKSTTTEPTRSNELSEFAPQPPPRLLSWTGSAVCADRGTSRSSHRRAKPAARQDHFPRPSNIKIENSRFGQDAVLGMPQRPAILASLPLGPVPKQGSGNLSPPAPGAKPKGPGSRGNLSLLMLSLPDNA